MNLDDFLVPSSIGTPSGISPSPSSNLDLDHHHSATHTTTNTASAIPIKQQQRLQAEELALSRASAPSVPPYEQNRNQAEFGYVQRHVRKTSIDDRRVRIYPSHVMRTMCSLASPPVAPKAASSSLSASTASQR
jgi:GATA-binding protein, other eukaryote